MSCVPAAAHQGICVEAKEVWWPGAPAFFSDQTIPAHLPGGSGTVILNRGNAETKLFHALHLSYIGIGETFLHTDFSACLPVPEQLRICPAAVPG